MAKKDNQKQEQGQEQPRLSVEQIKSLADKIAINIDEYPAAALMLLMEDIANHPYDSGHVDGIANYLIDRLFMEVTFSNDALREYVRIQRAAFFEAQEGGRA